ncbi:pitrilysin family protein [Mesobacterium sp. TK19101]|uniref:Pitrilysin family protein n=1 Tax=Mesobacterium hydrothermale TaxID=3111907 RepID=A0ABU6HK92_9RHOB|nr:pitrilysin family protein [Mesobacterium sp. TK19101]MEC3862874.1 pitrilysin family protein [Mesobacterium sp. TK19101]
MRVLVIVAVWVLTAIPALAEVKIQEVTSPGGIKAWLVEEHSIPFTALELRFRGGTSLDAADTRGATSLMVALLEEGAGDKDARAFTEASEALAAKFRFRPYDDAVSVSARMLTENRDQAVALLRDSLVAPRFDADAIERVRGQVISSIRSDLKDPDAIAMARLDALAFGDHPYGHPTDGTEDSVAALTRDDLLSAHRGALARDRVYVSAAGDITAEELGALLDTLLGDLPETGAPMPEDVPVALTGGVDVVPFDTPQSVAVFAQEGIARDDPDFFAAYVMNTILGNGGFESRLMDEVREKRGLTYGVYSYLVPKDHAALYLGRVASANETVAEAIKVIRDEWEKMARDGATEAELTRVKTYLTGAYPLRLDGNASIADILVGMQMDGLSPDYVNTRNAKVEALTLDDIKRVAARLLDPDTLTFVVVGRPVGLETPG